MGERGGGAVGPAPRPLRRPLSEGEGAAMGSREASRFRLDPGFPGEGAVLLPGAFAQGGGRRSRPVSAGTGRCCRCWDQRCFLGGAGRGRGRSVLPGLARGAAAGPGAGGGGGSGGDTWLSVG